MSHNIRSRFQPPELYSIHQGTVTRIEPYGCFVKLSPSPTTSAISGLVHISQLHANKISDVNDVVNLEDVVFVKVIDVQVEQVEFDRGGDGGGGGEGFMSSGRSGGSNVRQRHKIKLSMKYVHQDTGEDLDPQNSQLEEDMFRSKSGGGGRGGNNNTTEDGTYGANSQLGRALASNIGMSSAIDPGNLILKGKKGGADGLMAGQTFNGYEMVGEDEGEAPIMEDVTEHTATATLRDVPAPAPVRPMGRGRGTTLPAWMTRQDDNDRLGSINNDVKNGNEEPRERSNGNDSDRDDKRRSSKHDKKSKRDKRDKHHKRKTHRKYHRKSHRHDKEDRRHSSSRRHHDRKKHKKEDRHRQRHSRSRSRSRSPSSASSVYSSRSEYSRNNDDDEHHRKNKKLSSRRSFSRSRSPSRRSSSNRRSREAGRHRHSDKRRGRRSRSRSQSRSVSRSPSTRDDGDFANVEEARAIMLKLERQRQEL